MSKDNGSDVVTEYCKAYPKMKSYTLARKIFEENPNRFINLNAVRMRVNRRRGLNGEYHRKMQTNPELRQPKNYDTTNYDPRKEEIYSKILILDIETAPLLANLWGIWNQNIQLDNIHSDWFILTWAAKWLFEDKVYSARVRPQEAKNQDDKRILKPLLSLISEADIIITHNGDKFDMPRINTRALIHNFEPPLPYISIDTLKVAKKQFNFTSNKLDFINKKLGLNPKTETNMELWRDCFLGKEEPLKRMETYNINDVRIQEEMYLRLRPWIKPHPNVALNIMDETQERCPTCGSAELKEVGKTYKTTVNQYELLRCECGATSRRRKSANTSKQNRMILSSSPR